MAASISGSSTKKMKVFFPSHCLTKKSGFIFGWKIEKERIFVATTVFIPPQNSYNLRTLSEILKGDNSVSLCVLGIWLNEDDAQNISEVLAAAKTLSSTGETIILRLARHSRVPHLFIDGAKLKPDGSIVILYNQPSSNAYLADRPPTGKTSNFWKQFLYQEEMPPTEMSNVLGLINKSRIEEAKLYALLKTKGHSAYCKNFMNMPLQALRKVCGIFSQSSTGRHSIWALKILKFLLSVSAVILQSCVRFNQVRALCTCVAQSRSTEDEQNLTESTYSSKKVQPNKEKTGQGVFPLIWFGSLITVVSIDIVLGLVIVSWLFANGYNACATDFLMEKTDTVVEFLTELLDWLKGAPAGLKLNKHLAEYLSMFFLYHIYLWQIYLSCIEPYLQVITSLIIMSGCLGVTFLLSLVSDVLSVVTLHIYCFYVYAARLYNFQLKKLITLFRLFTGRRWNVETNQIDIVPFKADRLFVGTLGFTVLLFLLPTTAMYYVVFTVLRLIVLFVKGIVAKAIDTMNSLPVFALTVACVRPDLIPGGVNFELQESPDSSSPEFNVLPDSFIRKLTGPVPSVCLVLRNQPLPITQLLCRPLVDKFAGYDDHKHDWPSLLGKLAKGELIYPWVKPRHSK